MPTTNGEREKLFEAELGRKERNFLHWKWMLVCSGRCCMKRTQNFGRVGGFSCVSAFPILEPLSMHVLSSPHLLKERVGQGHTYIVPLQRDLNLTPSVDIPGELSNG